MCAVGTQGKAVSKKRDTRICGSKGLSSPGRVTLPQGSQPSLRASGTLEMLGNVMEMVLTEARRKCDPLVLYQFIHREVGAICSCSI